MIMTDIGALIDGLFNKDNQLAYKCFQELEKNSEQSNIVYKYFDTFAEMINGDNSYVRSRGLILISANAKWDEDYKIDEIIGRYLKHILDIKPFTARQCIKALPHIAKHKPELKPDIILALNKADTSFYADTMQPLVDKDIRENIAVSPKCQRKGYGKSLIEFLITHYSDCNVLFVGTGDCDSILSFYNICGFTETHRELFYR